MTRSGATYQRLVDYMFRDQLGRNMEVYVDDILVKSRQTDQYLADLAETFNTLRKFHMKLNPAKCAFGVRSGKFLGYMVTEKGIEVNPEKIRAIQEMKPPAIGIRMDPDAGARNLIAYSDSQLVTEQVEDEYEIKEERMKEYLEEISDLTSAG
ncbi:UNVERIFIED_CONTAM: Retrovirus-related Pol polyprotein from transposon opus [Sesamum radiatum]|uniref:Retrovirus-related Pol polyprotein from transposon opus n=1 Tax=Sesamum radiatum TaxID=300843 RepID=A0AAW2UAQ7_SESRA